MLQDVVHAINIVLKHEIFWSVGQKLLDIQIQFQQLCSLLNVVDAIDYTQVGIKKPKHGLKDYYYFKTSDYSINCQTLVDNKKKFSDLYVEILGLINDSHILR